MMFSFFYQTAAKCKLWNSIGIRNDVGQMICSIIAYVWNASAKTGQMDCVAMYVGAKMNKAYCMFVYSERLFDVVLRIKGCLMQGNKQIADMAEIIVLHTTTLESAVSAHWVKNQIIQ